MENVYEFEAIGTKWRIEYALSRGAETQAKLQHMIVEVIDSFDRSFSRFRHDSWVWSIREQAGTYNLPEHAFELFTLYRAAYEATNGLVTPLIGTAMEQAGYDSEYSFDPKPLTFVADFSKVTFTKESITTPVPILLDFGAAGKGYLIDLVGAILKQAGVENLVINAGGDILHYAVDKTAISIGLENPNNTSEAIGICSVSNASLCGSAGSRRAWGEFTHIIDPDKLQSPTDIAATWAYAKTAALADLLATALYFAPPEQLSQQFEFGYAILDSDMNVAASKNFPLTLFTEQA